MWSLVKTIFILILLLALPVPAQTGKGRKSAGRLPQFTDYPVREKWRGPAAKVRLTTKSEHMFRTRLTDAAKEPPDFAGHYRIAGWGCGSACVATAIVNLKTGLVYPPPLAGKGEGWQRWMNCAAWLDDKPLEYRRDSRLMIVRCGWDVDENGRNWPDVYYLLWQGTRFEQLLHVKSPKAQ